MFFFALLIFTDRRIRAKDRIVEAMDRRVRATDRTIEVTENYPSHGN
ncbi:hypothetical protein [Lysinibacillus xylanilyticus]|nr:hypothetical protein [Lysinibacillus xylanilyticus]